MSPLAPVLLLLLLLPLYLLPLLPCSPSNLAFEASAGIGRLGFLSASILPLPLVLISFRARAPSSATSSAADSALISSLRSKHDRLEKQNGCNEGDVHCISRFDSRGSENRRKLSAQSQERMMLAANGLGDP